MPNIFEVTDPEGRTVICTDENWNGHVVYHHAEMEDRVEEVKRTIQEPTFGIYSDQLHNDRLVYYRFQKGKLRYMKVVVVNLANVWSVITAFQTDSPKRGEKMVWPRSNT